MVVFSGYVFCRIIRLKVGSGANHNLKNENELITVSLFISAINSAYTNAESLSKPIAATMRSITPGDARNYFTI